MSAAIQLAGDAMTGHTGEKYSVGGAPTREKVAASVTSMDSEVAHQLVHRKLTPRQIQLLALAGTGAALFVGIGTSLRAGGPASLFIAMCIWVSVVWTVALAQAEMVALLPYDGSFIRNAGKYVDEAYGVMTGWNYAIFQAALICFEINIFSTVLGYWKEIHPAIMPSVLIPVYFALNIWSVSFFGEAEFYLALGKLLLILGCLFYTFITMVGGNPTGEAFGFRYWNNPGAFREFRSTGTLGRFEGFLQCLIGVAFIVAGPEYISMVAGEAKRPRKTMPKAFSTIIYRLAAFFCLGALSVGIVVPYNEPNLLGGVSAASSPYVLSMSRLNIPVLDSIVNALILTSIFSAGNAYVFGTSRSLYSLALAGHAPKQLTLCNRHGVPWVCVVITTLVSCLSYLSVSAGSAVVLTWWTNLVTAGQLMNWLIMATTYLFFHRVLKVQGRSRDSLPYKSWAMPYGAYYILFMATVVLGISGYVTLTPGNWAVDDFLFAYGMCFFDIIVFFAWKLWKRTSFVKPEEVDFSDVDIFDAYEAEYAEQDSKVKKNLGDRISAWIFD